MSIEREAMRGRLAARKDQLLHLQLRIEGLCRSIRQELNTALTPVAELQVPLVAEQLGELELAWGELQITLAEIDRLEKELR